MKKYIPISILLIAILASCGGQSKAGKAGAEGDLLPMGSDGNKITAERTELVAEIFSEQSRPYMASDAPVLQALGEETNVYIINEAPSNTDSATGGFNRMMASSELPEIAGGGNLKALIMQYGTEGAFIPLNDLIAEHAPHIQQVLDQKPAVKKFITAPDGNIYMIPYVTDGSVARGYFIRQDWLDKLGLAVPDTVDDLYAVLTAFRNQDPNGNGKKDEVPFFGRHWQEVVRLVTFWGGRQSGSDNYLDFYLKDGKIHLGMREDAFKVGMKNIAKWYAEGLIDPEIFTRGKKSREYMFSNNLGGFTHDWFGSTSSYNSYSAQIPDFNLVPLPPPKNANGTRLEENYRTIVRRDSWGITVNAKNPVLAIRFMDFLFAPKGREIANFGVEGLTYELRDGKPYFLDSILNNDTPVNTQLWQIGAQFSWGFWQDYEYERQWTNEAALRGIDMYEKGGFLLPAEDRYILPNLSGDDLKTYNNKWATLQTFMTESIQKWILGSGDVEADWDNYLSQLEILGAQELIDMLQVAYDKN